MLPLFLVGSLLVSPASAGRLHREMDRFVAEHYGEDEPGATVLVVREGEVVLREAYGMADLELGLPMEPDHVLRIGSVTKQFTAAGILLLQQDGVLSVDDPITRFLPDYPTHGHTIRIRDLLTHTSGVYDYTEDWDYMSGPGIRRDLSTDALLDVFASRPMNFAPGTDHAYSNSGYVLLGAILEEASGLSWGEFLADRVFEPLGMEHTRAEPTQALVERRARGYEQRAESWQNATFLSMTQPHAAGALVSTVDDLALWNRALSEDGLLSAASKQAMWTGPTIDDQVVPYGFGWDLDPFRGHPSQSHRGGVSGFGAKVVRVPDAGVFVALLSNRDDPDLAGYVADHLAAIAVGAPFPDVSPVSLGAEELARFEGFYEVDGGERRVRATAEGLETRRGSGRPMHARPHGPTAFHYPESHTWFDFEVQGGEVVAMRMHQNGREEPEIAPRVRGLPQAVELPREVLGRYVGSYRLRPGYALQMRVVGSRLQALGPDQEPVDLIPSSETEFFTPERDAVVRFEADGASLVLVESGVEYRAAREP